MQHAIRCYSPLIAPVGNLAFLIRHNQSRFGKKVYPEDISIASRNWNGMVSGSGQMGIGIFVIGNGYTHTVLKATVQPGASVLDKLTQVVEGFLEEFVPVV